MKLSPKFTTAFALVTGLVMSACLAESDAPPAPTEQTAAGAVDKDNRAGEGANASTEAFAPTQATMDSLSLAPDDCTIPPHPKAICKATWHWCGCPDLGPPYDGWVCGLCQ